MHLEVLLGSLQVGAEEEEVAESYGELGVAGEDVLDLPVELLGGGVVPVVVAPAPGLGPVRGEVFVPKVLDVPDMA